MRHFRGQVHHQGAQGDGIFVVVKCVPLPYETVSVFIVLSLMAREWRMDFQ